MMHDKAWRALCAASFGLILCACAGGDTPSTDDEFEQAVAERFRNGSVASAGGTGGRSGSGGSGTAAAGRNAGGGEGPVSSGGSGQLPDEDDDEPPSSSSGECDGFEILAANCGSGGCHGANSTFSNFAESEAAALSFVGESGESSCAAEGPLLDPENPAASIIIQKVTASSPPCGTRMPVVGGPLSQADITCLQEWIGTL